MKRLVWIAAGSLVLGFAFGIEACGGGDDSVGGGSDGGGGGDGTIGTGDDGGGGGEGGTTDGGGGTGPISNPGEATCGPTLTCDVDAGRLAIGPVCCERRDGGDSCEVMASACNGATFRLECDESADCPDNNHDCCMKTNSIGASPDAGGLTTGQAQCNDHCGGKDLQLCKTAAECGDGGACALVTCKGGNTFYACNTNDDCK